MKWENISVAQFQEIYKLSQSADLEDVDKVTRAICIVFNKTEREVEELTISEFNDLAKKCSFLFNDEVPGKCANIIKVGNKKYGIQYNPQKLRHRQYVEILHFSDKPIENMHLIMASLVTPMKRKRILFIPTWLEGRNEAKDHDEISADMLNARVIDVYHACIFFCKLYANLIEVMRDFLVVEMMNKGVKKEEAENLITASRNAMAGFTQQGKSQHLRA